MDDLLKENKNKNKTKQTNKRDYELRIQVDVVINNSQLKTRTLLDEIYCMPSAICQANVMICSEVRFVVGFISGYS